VAIACDAIEKGRGIDCICIESVEILVEHIDLRLNLCIGNVLSGIAVQHMHHHRNGQQTIVAGIEMTDNSSIQGRGIG